MQTLTSNLLAGCVLCLSLYCSRGLRADDAAVPDRPLGMKGELLFEDDFERDSLGEWKVVIPGFAVQDGVLVGTQERDDHGAVGRVNRDMQNVVVEFRFRLEGSPRFNAVFDDRRHKGSHAGHICRVAFTPKGLRLGDDKEGVMRNDIFEIRNEPNRTAEVEELLKGRSAWAPFTIDQHRWYHAAIEVVGDRMRVSMDGKPVGYLQSPGLSHPTKTSFHFSVNGPGLQVDDVRIWQAETSETR